VQSQHRVRSGQLIRRHHGVYAVGYVRRLLALAKTESVVLARREAFAA